MKTLRVQIILAAIMLLSVIIVSPSAVHSSTTIDFGPGLGGPATSYIELTDQLDAFGVTFSSSVPGGVRWYGGDYAWSPARYSITTGPFPSCVSACGLGPIRIDFNPFVSDVTIRGFDGGGDIDMFSLRSFNVNDFQTDLDSVTYNFTDPGVFLSVSAPEISYVTFDVVVGGNHGIFFDDLSFTPVVPEPISSTLFIVGGIIMGLRQIRKTWE